MTLACGSDQHVSSQWHVIGRILWRTTNPPQYLRTSKTRRTIRPCRGLYLETFMVRVPTHKVGCYTPKQVVVENSGTHLYQKKLFSHCGTFICGIYLHFQYMKDTCIYLYIFFYWHFHFVQGYSVITFILYCFYKSVTIYLYTFVHCGDIFLLLLYTFLV